MKGLATLLILAGAILAPRAVQANAIRVDCYAQEGVLFMRCPIADRGWLKHRAAIYAGMFRGNEIPKNIKDLDPFSCGVDAKSDLTDCIEKK